MNSERRSSSASLFISGHFSALVWTSTSRKQSVLSSMAARTGREKQRYEDDFRLVAGCIPYKIERKIKRDNLLVLMISSPKKDYLVFPKGGWEDDETIAEAASREAFEEAGVKGILAETPLGVWEFRSKSREKMSSSGSDGSCRGYMFGMEVTQELEFWPERSNYHRKWVNAEEAFRFCRYDWMREALHRLLASLSVSNDIDVAL